MPGRARLSRSAARRARRQPDEVASPKRLRTFLLVVGAIKLAIVWSGWSETSLISDDAYYYFTIARNVARGLGPTFDGTAPTNGFHPLWVLVLLPLFGLAPHSMWTPVRAALSIEVLLDSLSGLLLFRLLEPRLGRRTAALAAGIWLCAPTGAILAFTGMEGSLVAFLLLALLRQLLDEDRRRRWPRRHAVVTGLLWGLCGLARTDHIVLGLAALGASVVRRREGRKETVRWLALAGVVAALVLVPWFAWNLRTFGTLEQSSSQAKRLAHGLWGALPSDWSSLRAAIASGVTCVFAPVVVVVRWLCTEDLTHHPVRWSPALTGLVLVPGLWLAIRGASRMRAQGAAPLLRLAATYLAAHTILYGMVLRFYAPWYATPYLALSAALVGAGLSLQDGATRWRRLAPAAAALLVAGEAALPVLFARQADHGRRGAEYRWKEHFDDVLRRSPDGARVGLFDAGAAGYVSGWVPGIHVVDLDGLVNNEAVAAMKQGRYPEYLLQNVDLVLQSVRRTRMFLSEPEYDRLLRMLEERGVRVDNLR